MSDPTCLLIQDIINSPAKAESVLEHLTAEQIVMIENTLNRVKHRKINKPIKQEDTSTTASAIANALAAAMVSAALQIPATKPVTPTNDPVAEMKDGVEWVSFVYSHNRVLKRYSIRTDIQNVALDAVEDKFKAENCVYPRANLPKENYKGNRWCYETECNDLGWKLAWLNPAEIAGKRGLIQRAVDSYRNRYPSMRSRRVARQEKLLNGTLRKRKAKEEEDEELMKVSPKTMAFEGYRIKINMECVSLDDISVAFRQQNSPFPRALNVTEPDHYIGGRTRWVEDTLCNEVSWKLAYLNPKILAGKKNVLQRALNIYRTKFIPHLQPRKYSHKPTIDKPKKKKKKEVVSLDEIIIPLESDPMMSTSSCEYTTCLLSPSDDSSSSGSSLACTPSPTSGFFGLTDTDLYDSFMLPPVNDTFLMFDNDTNMGIKCQEPSSIVQQDLIKLEDDFHHTFALLEPLF
ncbi:hypothetical protein BDB01DRAFT_852639 [Pilobolus umbonatus]|nr:hypothetical protein BDB01DRAFT_852639 [Pilobolus umbonatus]